ncbi:DUF3846 domain-containing protein [uncultured Microbacterium sp.]|uniref:DUF3846 domain-containing protein n=1 Tax=uncultured Microbacterium sp. TaxID=191216 RepID=UPI0028EB1BA7|nr:hypothetical protein [uncultured Microbacterium sp.]
MVKSIVIPHDPTQAPRLRELADAGDFQEAVDGWLGLVEMPAVGVTVYVNEAALREHQPINCRAMAIWWLYTANPTQCPFILGNAVLTGAGDDELSGDVPEAIVRDIFDDREFVVQTQLRGATSWRDTYARFNSIFDAATWCIVFSHTMGPGGQFRLRSRDTLTDAFDDSFTGGDESW